jgi:hypothetical protein
MAACITVFPLGNADALRLDLADGRKVLVDFGNQGDPDDVDDLRCDLAEELRADLRKVRRDSFNAVCFTHLDADHCDGASDFFWFQHAAKYQGEGRVKIDELWVPAAAITEDGLEDCGRVIRQEARYRLREGKGIRVFSRPDVLKEWMQKNAIDFESRKHLIVDAGQLVPGFSKEGAERAEFFVHCPFAWRTNDNELVDRNQDSIVFQVTFKEDGVESYALLGSDVDHETLSLIVQTTKRHNGKNGSCGISSSFRITPRTCHSVPSEVPTKPRQLRRSSGCSKRKGSEEPTSCPPASRSLRRARRRTTILNRRIGRPPITTGVSFATKTARSWLRWSTRESMGRSRHGSR